MSRITFFILMVFLIAAPSLSFASVSVISANGFKCSEQKGLVQCLGTFPGHSSPALSIIGSIAVGVIAQYPDHLWNYRSDTGCLCKGSFQSMTCTSRGGKKKAFKGAESIKKSSTWCYQYR